MTRTPFSEWFVVNAGKLGVFEVLGASQEQANKTFANWLWLGRPDYAGIRHAPPLASGVKSGSPLTAAFSLSNGEGPGRSASRS